MYFADATMEISVDWKAESISGNVQVQHKMVYVVIIFEASDIDNYSCPTTNHEIMVGNLGYTKKVYISDVPVIFFKCFCA